MGIAYVAAAFGVVPALLFVFNRLSRTPEIPHDHHDDVPFADPAALAAPSPPSVSSALSVADEAERWLQGQR